MKAKENTEAMFTWARVASFVLLFMVAAPPCAVGDRSSSLIGVTGRDFVLLAADTAFRRGSQVIVRDHDRITRLGPRIMLATAGDGASSDQFVSFLSANLALADVVHGRPTSARSAAHFTRREIHRLLRRSPVQADFLLAGVDDGDGAEGAATLEGERDGSGCVRPQLHWIDRTGAACELKYAAQGPSAPMVVATMDERWREGMDVDEALELLGTCIEQLAGRYAVSPQGWRVKVVDSNGANRLLATLEVTGSRTYLQRVSSDDESGSFSEFNTRSQGNIEDKHEDKHEVT